MIMKWTGGSTLRIQSELQFKRCPLETLLKGETKKGGAAVNKE
jgi:hypothetical protein